MSTADPASPEAIVDEIIRMSLASAPEPLMAQRLCELTGITDEQHALEHVYDIWAGFRFGRQMGSLLFGFSSIQVVGTPLYLAAYNRGYSQGLIQKALFKIFPIAVVVIVGVLIFRALR